MPGWDGSLGALVDVVVTLSAVVVISEILGALHVFRLWWIVATMALAGLVAWWAGRPSGQESATPLSEAGTSATPPPGGMQGPRPCPALAGRALTASRFLAVAATALVVADWTAPTVSAFHRGITTVDSLWYHLPFAARWVQTGAIGPMHYIDTTSNTEFFPASGSIFHALGMVFMGTDVLSPLMNMGWLAVALLAAWCVGRPYGLEPLTLASVACLLVTPGLVATQPGGAYDDIVGISMLLAAVSVLGNGLDIHGWKRRPDPAPAMAIAGADSAPSPARPGTASGSSAPAEPRARTGQPVETPAVVVAGLAAGFALGVKLTLLAPVGVLTLGLLILWIHRRQLRLFALWLGAMVVTGVFWYARNLIAVGNPLPTLHVKLGPISLPTPKTTYATSTVSQFLTDGHTWSVYFLPGFRLALGPLWWALFGLCGLGMALGIWRGGTVTRLTAVTGVAAVVFFLFTPQYLSILGAAVFFVYNLRYADPGLVLGLVVLPVALFGVVSAPPESREPLLPRNGWPVWLFGSVLLATIGLTQLDGSIWPTTSSAHVFSPPPHGLDAWIGALMGVVAALVGTYVVLTGSRAPDPSASQDTGIRPEPARMSRKRAAFFGLGVVAGLGVLVVGGYALETYYLDHRFPGDWADRVHGARIGVTGQWIPLQYKMAGNDDSNFVQAMVQVGPHGSVQSFPTCQAWRRAVNRGHFQYLYLGVGPVAIGTQPTSAVPGGNEWLWTEGSPAVERVFEATTVPKVTPGNPANFAVERGVEEINTLFRVLRPLDPAACSRQTG